MCTDSMCQIRAPATGKAQEPMDIVVFKYKMFNGGDNVYIFYK